MFEWCIISSFILIAICICNRDKVIGGKIYPSYGFFNESNNRVNGIYYSVSSLKLFYIFMTLGTVFIPLFIIATCIMVPRCTVEEAFASS